jgi:hypothetical protein
MMPQSAASGKGADVGWLAALALLSAAWCLSAAARTGVTYDESHYVPSGLAGWRDGTCDRLVVWGTMPLPIDVQTAPLYFWERVSGRPVSDNLLKILPYARAGNLLFWWLLLGYVLLFGRAVGGPWAGRIAAGLVAFDPNLLGHAALATTDIAVAALLVGLAFHAYTGRGIAGRLIVPGLLYGLAITAKASAILYGGVMLVVLEACRRATDGSLRGGSYRAIIAAGGRSMLILIGIVLIGCTVVVAYCGWEQGGDGPVAALAAKLPPDDPWRPVLDQVAAFPLTPKAAAAVVFQARHNEHGRGVFLLGTWHPQAVWYYYPLVLAMKLPTPVVLLLAGIAVRRPRSLLNPPGLVAGAWLAAALTAQVQLGVRLVFPVVVAGVVALAVAAGCTPGGRIGGLAAVVATAGVAVWSWPNGISYLNSLAGGPQAAHRRLADSNVDWGQGLIELARWHKAHGWPPLAVWYFGTDPRAYAAPFRPVALHELPLTCESDVPARLGPTLLAVGHSVAYQSPDETPAKLIALAWLRRQTPIDQTSTFTIYAVRPDR